MLPTEEEIKNACMTSKSMLEASRVLNMSFSTFKRAAQKFNCYKPNQGWRKYADKNKDLFSWKRFEKLKKILSGLYPEYQPYKLKSLLFQFGLKENRCQRCGISEWNGMPINCQLHHKDGNRFNNSLDNLQILCPNCHSQTENFRSKNGFYKQEKKINL